ncbi:MAG: DJ-1/PfpI family protein [Kiritimatiellae bacterium]|nr:DJ-1/PfpI family protein [Kiritimatiellia bacterium]
MSKVCVLVAPGSEELETVAVVDVLRRAGADVFLAGVAGPGAVRASRGVGLVPDGAWDAAAADGFDALVVPGGMGGVEAIGSERSVLDALRRSAAAGKWIAAICAGPRVLDKAGLLEGKRFTCYPGVEKGLAAGGKWLDDPVVVDGRLVTSQGPGTAVAFALALAECLEGLDAAQRTAAGMLLAWPPEEA